jgi:hypothetical protein
MTTAATTKSEPAWQAEVAWARRYYTAQEEAPTHPGEEATAEKSMVSVLRPVMRCYVHISRPGCDRISFLVNHREGRDVTFTDPRGRNMGTAGVTGIWGTRPAPRAYKPRPLSISAFRFEVARLIGAERADEIIRTLSSPDFFWNDI